MVVWVPPDAQAACGTVHVSVWPDAAGSAIAVGVPVPGVSCDEPGRYANPAGSTTAAVADSPHGSENRSCSETKLSGVVVDRPGYSSSRCASASPRSSQGSSFESTKLSTTAASVTSSIVEPRSPNVAVLLIAPAWAAVRRSGKPVSERTAATFPPPAVIWAGVMSPSTVPAMFRSAIV